MAAEGASGSGSEIELELVEPSSTAVTPRSALTTAFSLLLQTSADLAFEAAAVAATIASALSEEHSDTLASFGLPPSAAS